MSDNEAIVISGFEKFCDYTGYGWPFKFSGNRVNPQPSRNVLIAVDAIACKKK